MDDQISLARYSGAPPADRSNLVMDALEANLAPRTRAVYASHWRHWQAWCVENGVTALPAAPEDLATYLAERAQRHAISTVRTAAAAVGAVHAIADVTGAFGDDTGKANPAQHEGVKLTLKGLARQHSRRSRQVKGLTALNLAGIAATARWPRYREGAAEAKLRGTTDLAMIGLMRDAMLRRSEAAALTWDDLSEEEDGSGRIYIARSKTDQEGEGAAGYVSPQTMRWVKELRQRAGERERIIGLSPHQIARRIASAAEAAGLTGRYGGHSPRIGMTLDLAEANVQLPSLMQVGRWKSPAMPALYIRNLSAGHNAVATWYKRQGQ